MYQPDALATFRVGKQEYRRQRRTKATSATGDGFSEEMRIGASDIDLDPAVFPNAGDSPRATSNLGRLKITSTSPQGPNGSTELHTFGARSFSIWKANGRSCADTGDDFEQITPSFDPRFFNASNDKNNFDDRSDDKGPEPEGIAVGEIDGRRYAFTALERVGGLMIYDITDEHQPTCSCSTRTRGTSTSTRERPRPTPAPKACSSFPTSKSPTGQPLVIVSHEVSGTRRRLLADRPGRRGDALAPAQQRW